MVDELEAVYASPGTATEATGTAEGNEIETKVPGVDAEGKTLESIAQPLSAAKERLGSSKVEPGQEPPAAIV